MIKGLFFNNNILFIEISHSQSNGVGAAMNTTLPSFLSNGIKGAFIWNRYSSKIEPLDSSNNTQFALEATPYALSFGCEMYLGFLLKKQYLNKKVVFVKTAIGSTSLYPGASGSPYNAYDWSPETNNLKPLALTNYNNAKTACGKNSLEVFIKIQGEQDTSLAASAAYQSRLIAELNYLNSTRSPKLIIVVSLSDNQTGLNATYRTTVQSAQMAVASAIYNGSAGTGTYTLQTGGVTISNVVCIRQNELTSDGYHYNVGSNPYGNIAQYIATVIQNYIS